jgi:hypothetical protein
MGITPPMRRAFRHLWVIAGLGLLLAGLGLWIAGRGDQVFALGILVTCGGMIAKWAYARLKKAERFSQHS